MIALLTAAIASPTTDAISAAVAAYGSDVVDDAAVTARLDTIASELACPVGGWVAGAYTPGAATGADQAGPLASASFTPTGKVFNATGSGTYSGTYTNQGALTGTVDGDAFAGFFLPVTGSRGVFFGLVEDCAPPTPARVVIVLLDDVGYGVLDAQDPGIHPVPIAPAFDQLAADGVRFARAYASPVCSTTRASLLTGREAARDHVTDHAVSIQPQALEASWPVAMRDAGWATRLVGKWHLSGTYGNPGPPVLTEIWSPTVGGFQTWRAVEADTNDGPFLVGDETGTIHEWTGETTERYLTDTLGWLQVQTDPAVAVVALTNAHLPWVAPQEDWDAVSYIHPRDRGYFAEVRAADRAIGDFVAALDEADMLDDTLLIVASDNGARDMHGSPNGALYGKKQTMTEGGSRVPMVIHWPDGSPGGRVVDAPVSLRDLGHTITSLAGVPWSHLVPTDGHDQSGVVLGSGPVVSTGLGIVHRPSRGDNASWLDASGRWKIERDAGVVVLRDLVADPTGATDVSATEPAMLATMTAELAAFEASVAASATCADLPDGECFFTRRRKSWHAIDVFQPYLSDWCTRPEFDCQGSYP